MAEEEGELSRLGPVAVWSRLSLWSRAFTVIGLLALVAVASSARIAGRSAQDSRKPDATLRFSGGHGGPRGPTRRRRLCASNGRVPRELPPTVYFALGPLRCSKLLDASGGRKPGGGRWTFFVTGLGLFDVAVSLAGLLLLVGGVVLLVRQRRSAAVGEESAEEALAAVAVESLDDLRAEGDVRRAIIACYARMERALAAVGASRRPAEAPLEYLRRVLTSVAPTPGSRLTELFERAAFSVEPMGVPERERAIAALEALRAATL